MLEETGYVASEWIHLTTAWPCIGYADERMEYFLARGLTHQGRKLDDGEFLEVFELSLPDAIEWIRLGKINESKTIVGLFWLEKYLNSWRVDWSALCAGGAIFNQIIKQKCVARSNGMRYKGRSVENLKINNDTLFILLGAIMVLAMHAGFAFLELGTVRKKNQVNALVKILTDFAISTLAYFFIGYAIAYGVNFFTGAEQLAQKSGYELVKFFFLLTFAAAIPAIVSGGIAERAKFHPQMAATFMLVGFVYPFFEGIAWNHHFGIQDWLHATFGAEFHDFAGSVVVHAVGGWIALAAVLLLGARRGRYNKEGRISAHPPSSIPFLALGAWILTVGWFGFNVMSAQTINNISGLVAVNSLMAMVGGTLTALWMGKNDPGLRA